VITLKNALNDQLCAYPSSKKKDVATNYPHTLNVQSLMTSVGK